MNIAERRSPSNAFHIGLIPNSVRLDMGQCIRILPVRQAVVISQKNPIDLRQCQTPNFDVERYVSLHLQDYHLKFVPAGCRENVCLVRSEMIRVISSKGYGQ
jgi:hypothetical protein